MRAQEFVREGLPPFLTNVFRAGEPAVAKAVNAFKNIVVPPPTSSSMLTGRAPAKPEDITHAYRLMSTGELEHAQANGAFLPNPNANRANGWDTNHKYWSSGDEQGQFGRTFGGDARVSVRVPIDKVPSDTAVNAGHAEVLNKETGEWAPVVMKP